MNDERPRQGPSEAAATKPLLTSEPTRAVRRTAAATPNLVTMRPEYARAWTAGYAEGFAHGYARALDDIEADDARAWAKLSRAVRRQAASPRFSQLCDRRGDQQKAERARELERRNGLDLIS